MMHHVIVGILQEYEALVECPEDATDDDIRCQAVQDILSTNGACLHDPIPFTHVSRGDIFYTEVLKTIE